ncbi:MAG: M48 family metalloprotease [Armatimonadota bacterium]
MIRRYTINTFIYILWILTGFGPSAVIAYLGIRAVHLKTGEVQADYSDASRILDWLMPGFAVIAVGIKFGSTGTANGSAVLPCFLMLLTYYAVRYLLDVLILRRNNPSNNVTLKDAIKHKFWSQGKAVGILACAVFYGPMGNTDHSFAPNIYLFLAFYIAGFWGEYFANMLTQNSSNVKVIRSTPLEEGELHNRIDEIASSMGLAHVDISVIRDKGFESANAAAINLYNKSHVMFTESLVRNLSKDEVDAVVAHEIGHCVDKNCWEFSNLYRFGFILIWLAIMAVAERGIDSLAPSLYFLQYIKWISLFIVPPLIMRWYSRQREQEADANYGILANPQACVSGLYKLHLLSGDPISRPAWSRLISTHPTLAERIDRIVSQYKLPESEIEQIYASAKADLDIPSCERYELSAVAAPDEASEKPDLLDRNTDNLCNQLLDKLHNKYGNHSDKSPMLVGFKPDNKDYWQFAWLIIDSGFLHLLGEADELKVELQDNINISLYDNPEDQDNTVVAISHSANPADRLLIDVPGVKLKKCNRPKSIFKLKKYIDQQISNAGINIPSQKKPPLNQILKRTPIAILALSMTLYLGILAYKLWDQVLLIMIIALVFECSLLYSWISHVPENDTDSEEEIDEQPKVPLRQLLIRIPISLAILSLVLYIVHLIMKLSGLDKVENLGWAPYVWAVIIIGGLLASWVFHTPKSKSAAKEVKVVLDDDQTTRDFSAL